MTAATNRETDQVFLLASTLLSTSSVMYWILGAHEIASTVQMHYM